MIPSGQNISTAVMQRADAIAAGQRWYYTGEPCPKGHIAKRSVSNRDCRGCVNLRTAARRVAKPEIVRANERESWARNADRRRAGLRRSRLAHLEKRREDDRNRYHNDPDRKAWQKSQAVTWGRTNKGKRVAMVAVRRAWIKLATPPWLTAEHKREIRAFYIEAAAREGEWHVDHIYPLRAKNSCGLNVPWNLQIITGDENRRKGNRL
jgi:hypothetical protein